VLFAVAVAIAGCTTAANRGLPAPTEGSVPPVIGQALTALVQLAVRDWDRSAPYDRDAFGQIWTDDVDAQSGRNGCDQRSDVLRRDLREVVLKAKTDGCVPASGVLIDPYSGVVIGLNRGRNSGDVHIDHVVALGNAWRTGAQAMTAQQRQNLAGDPLELLAVSREVNLSKSDSDAFEWLPPNAAFHCEYVARQIAVKAAYSLWVTADERGAMIGVLATCPDQPLPVAVTPPDPLR
jgi:Protein of unknown function (DUF1524)